MPHADQEHAGRRPAPDSESQAPDRLHREARAYKLSVPPLTATAMVMGQYSSMLPRKKAGIPGPGIRLSHLRKGTFSVGIVFTIKRQQGIGLPSGFGQWKKGKDCRTPRLSQLSRAFTSGEIGKKLLWSLFLAPRSPLLFNRIPAIFPRTGKRIYRKSL